MGPRFFKRGERISTGGNQWQTTASMGPRFFKRGENRLIIPSAQFNCSFNGATLFQAWRVALHENDAVSKRMLQWGHAFSSVESVAAAAAHRHRAELQWGHAFSSVESTCMMPSY